MHMLSALKLFQSVLLLGTEKFPKQPIFSLFLFLPFSEVLISVYLRTLYGWDYRWWSLNAPDIPNRFISL